MVCKGFRWGKVEYCWIFSGYFWQERVSSVNSCQLSLASDFISIYSCHFRIFLNYVHQSVINEKSTPVSFFYSNALCYAGGNLLQGLNMHILLMLALVIIGWGLGDGVSWLLGLPIICLGLYCFNLGGDKGRGWRKTQEDMFILIGLLAVPALIIANLLGL